jgi:hypothetical protein
MGADEVTFRADGRWGGKLTRRPVPQADPTVDALDDDQRRDLVDVWLGRAASERRVGDAFVVVRESLVDLGAAEVLVRLADRAVDDEMRHAELSRIVASRVAGKELDAPPRLALRLPRHEGASDELRRTLYVVGQCAFNETFASAFLEAALGAATGTMARAALRELLSDEIDHARIGWAHLAAVPASIRALVAPWLPAMTRANLRMWREAPRPYPTDPVLHAQGAPSAAMVEAALATGLTELVVPGFEALGMAVGPREPATPRP